MTVVAAKVTMSSRNFQDVLGYDNGECVLGGTFAPQGTSAPTVTSSSVGAWNVVRNSAGLFTVSLLDSNNNPLTLGQVKGIRVSLGLATPAELQVSVVNLDVATSTFQVSVFDVVTGSATDISANAANLIFWHLRACQLPSSFQ
jgi:hypothetical protein